MAFTSLKDLVEKLAEGDPVAGGVAPKLFVGRVRYMEQLDLKRAIAEIRAKPPKAVGRFAAEAILMKRIGFFHENEIRIFYVGNKTGKAKELDIELAGPAPIKDMLVGPYVPEGKGGALSRIGYYSAAADAAVRHAIPVSDSKFNLEKFRRVLL